MRNFTKVLALVLALTMVVGLVSFAKDYTDVEAGANYEEAVDVLSDLGLVKGYDDGSFGATKSLTRAEGVTFVVRLSNLEEAAISAAGTGDEYADVPADHWANGYISVATANGIVAGTGNGLFNPDAELKYEEIVKMIVAALGYYPLASELGEWPKNYISAASQIKLTTGIAGKAGEAVTRATTARLLYAALTIPKMEKKGVGVNATWEAGETMILDDLGLIKIKGEVASVDKVDEKAVFLATAGNMKAADAIEGKYVELKNNNEKYAYEFGNGVNVAKTGLFTNELADLVNLPIVAFLSNDDGRYTIESIVEQKNVETITITADQFKEFDTTVTNKLVYYTNDDHTKTANFNLDNASITGLVNGYSAVADFAAVKAKLETANAEFVAEFKDTDSDGLYDYVLFTEYTYFVVDEVAKRNNGTYRFTEKDLSTLTFDPENEAAIVNFFKDGKEIAVTDIAEDDVLNIIYTGSNTSGYLEDAQVYVTDAKVSATIKYVDTDEQFVAFTNGEKANYKYGVSGLASQVEATFYLNINDEIIYVDTENVDSAYDYGFATLIVLNGKAGNNTSATIRVLNTEGVWETLELKSSLTINNVAGKKVKDIAESANPFGASVDSIASADWSTKASGTTELVANKMIAYKKDSNGAIKDLAIGYANINTAVGNTVQLSGKNYKAYEDDDSTLGAYVVNDATKVFSRTGAITTNVALAEDEIEVATISIFNENDSYTVDAYNVNDKTSAIGVIYGTGFEAAIDFETKPFIVSKVYTTDFEEAEATQLIGYQNNEVVTYYVTADSDVKEADIDTNIVFGTTDFTSFAKGDILVVNAKANGAIGKAAWIGNISAFDGSEDFGTTSDFGFNGTPVSGDDEGYLVAGFVAGKAGTRVYLEEDATNKGVDFDATLTYDNTLIMNSSTTVTVYDITAAAKNTISEGDAGSIERGTIIIARADENDKLKDVIVIVTEDSENW